MSEILEVGGLKILLERSARRRTVGLSVRRDGSITATAPSEAPVERVAGLVRRRELWLHRALALRESSAAGAARKDYVSGEGFYHLGRRYRLKVLTPVESSKQREPLLLANGRFRLRADALADARGAFVAWYRRQAEAWLKERLPALQRRVGVAPSRTVVMDLGYRWGSCSAAGRINFHWRIVLLPVEIMTYLVLHELCHLREHSHGKLFWTLVARADPNFERKERWLKQHGAEFGL